MLLTVSSSSRFPMWHIRSIDDSRMFSIASKSACPYFFFE